MSTQSPLTPPAANPFVQSATPKATSRLPWIIVAVLAVICALLAGMLLSQREELARLRTQNANQGAQTTPAASASSQPQGKAQLPQPVTDPEGVKVLTSLPKRVDGDPLALGAKDAPVVMTVWSDFRCPFCSKWERDTLPALMPYVESGSLRIEHRDLVLFGEDSQRTAIGARAAGVQGKFWEFASAVAKAAPTSGHPAIDDAAVLAFAQQAGVSDLAKFKEDLANSALAKAVSDDSAYAKQIGLSGTPFFTVNLTPINGAVPAQVFAQVIEANGGKK